MNIKSFTKQTLSDAEIINLTADKRVWFLKAISPKTPYIEYQIFDEEGELWAENIEIETTYYVQVDIFSKDDYSILENKIKEKMINAGFDRSSSADLYESDTMLLHKSMRFLITL